MTSWVPPTDLQALPGGMELLKEYYEKEREKACAAHAAAVGSRINASISAQKAKAARKVQVDQTVTGQIKEKKVKQKPKNATTMTGSKRKRKPEDAEQDVGTAQPSHSDSEPVKRDHRRMVRRKLNRSRHRQPSPFLSSSEHAEPPHSAVAMPEIPNSVQESSVERQPSPSLPLSEHAEPSPAVDVTPSVSSSMQPSSVEPPDDPPSDVLPARFAMIATFPRSALRKVQSGQRPVRRVSFSDVRDVRLFDAEVLPESPSIFKYFEKLTTKGCDQEADPRFLSHTVPETVPEEIPPISPYHRKTLFRLSRGKENRFVAIVKPIPINDVAKHMEMGLDVLGTGTEGHTLNIDNMIKTEVLTSWIKDIGAKDQSSSLPCPIFGLEVIENEDMNSYVPDLIEFLNANQRTAVITHNDGLGFVTPCLPETCQGISDMPKQQLYVIYVSEAPMAQSSPKHPLVAGTVSIHAEVEFLMKVYRIDPKKAAAFVCGKRYGVFAPRALPRCEMMRILDALGGQNVDIADGPEPDFIVVHRDWWNQISFIPRFRELKCARTWFLWFGNSVELRECGFVEFLPRGFGIVGLELDLLLGEHSLACLEMLEEFVTKRTPAAQWRVVVHKLDLQAVRTASFASADNSLMMRARDVAKKLLALKKRGILGFEGENYSAEILGKSRILSSLIRMHQAIVMTQQYRHFICLSSIFSTRKRQMISDGKERREGCDHDKHVNEMVLDGERRRAEIDHKGGRQADEWNGGVEIMNFEEFRVIYLACLSGS
ncbi:hypothetical protein HK104_000086 [Borealophlyctis nickersoniae]|nr:hypothetical protein HK104_000086 [Borealophlyctis nickersoniae]